MIVIAINFLQQISWLLKYLILSDVKKSVDQ